MIQIIQYLERLVVLVADDKVHNSGGEVKRVNSGVDSSLGDRSEQMIK